jgi:large subunit ribosomal protein L49
MFARALLASTSRAAARTYSTATLPATPYIVERTANGSLPVYSDVRNGGTSHTTLVRKIRGDIEVSSDRRGGCRVGRTRRSSGG